MKWDLTYLFKTEEEFEKSFKKAQELSEHVKVYQGKLNDEKMFVEALKEEAEFDVLLSRLFQYCNLRSDQDQKNVQNAAELGKVYSLFMNYNTNSSYQAPEIIKLGKERVMEILEKNEDVSYYRFRFEQLFHEQEHILDDKSERLISYYSNLGKIGSDMYTKLSNADRDSEDVELVNGEHILVNQSNWTTYVEKLQDQEDRRRVFEAIYKFYESHKNSFAESYSAVMNAAKSNADARGYKSILGSFLFGNNIPEEVFNNLVEVAETENKSLKKYIELRKKYLHLDHYHTYDRFLQFTKSDVEYSFEDAKRLFFDSIKEMPEQFQEYAHEVLKDGFVDVYPSDGKCTGAYSSGVTDTHPFILLNYTNSLDDVFTVCHEAGHSIHSMFAMNNQKGYLQDYTIFVAEIASTFNEHMLLDYFMKQPGATREIKIQLLQKAIDEIVGTFYRQTLFADYEKRVSELVEKQVPINYEVLNNIMIELYKMYYGLDITEEVYKQYVWAYIPHMFHTPFYVYQYATSFSASFKLYAAVKNKEEKALDKYLGLLKSGGSDYPMNLTKEAGVDFTKKETFMAVVERMDYLVNELEKLLKEE